MAKYSRFDPRNKKRDKHKKTYLSKSNFNEEDHTRGDKEVLSTYTDYYNSEKVSNLNR